MATSGEFRLRAPLDATRLAGTLVASLSLAVAAGLSVRWAPFAALLLAITGLVAGLAAWRQVWRRCVVEVTPHVIRRIDGRGAVQEIRWDEEHALFVRESGRRKRPWSSVRVRVETPDGRQVGLAAGTSALATLAGTSRHALESVLRHASQAKLERARAQLARNETSWFGAVRVGPRTLALHGRAVPLSWVRGASIGRGRVWFDLGPRSGVPWVCADEVSHHDALLVLLAELAGQRAAGAATL